MVLEISGETPFQVLSHSLSISPSNEGYSFQFSANGVDYTSYDEAVPANENLIVNGVAFGQYVRLSGNASKVTVIY